MHEKTVHVLWGCFLLWNLHIASSQTIHPGIKARATQRALDYGESDAFRSQAAGPLVGVCTSNPEVHIGLSRDWDQLYCGVIQFFMQKLLRWLGRKCCLKNNQLDARDSRTQPQVLTLSLPPTGMHNEHLRVLKKKVLQDRAKEIWE